ncbi:hypothetical protein KQX54_017461 [Cotesia glomerata]|uniref:Uncharacterized protein n=1 Tax=Cotesia glomerata TaxID=32391 RepID=A0AAV7IFL4_COTGL|nr:hypothetical protein KQX54_017461 [Cotesia glomerata]
MIIMIMIMCNWDSIHSHKNRNWFSGTYKVLSECISLVVGTCLLLTTYYYILELLILPVLREEQAKKRFSSSLWLLTAFLTTIPILGSFALREMQMLALNPPFCTLGFRTGRQCTMQWHQVHAREQKWIIVFTRDNTWFVNGKWCMCMSSVIDFPTQTFAIPVEDTLMQLVVILSKRTYVKNQRNVSIVY